MAAAATLDVAVIMQRRAPSHPWASEAWGAVGVVRDDGGCQEVVTLACSAARETYRVPGLKLELHRDEHEGYAANCMAPEAKVFVMWRMVEGRAMPVQLSASYAEGTRMFDSGDSADGVTMPAEIHAWLADYLSRHYEPPPPHRRGHRG